MNPARRGAPDWLENEMCVCRACIGAQAWRAQLAARRARAARRAITGEAVAARGRKCRERKRVLGKAR